VIVYSRILAQEKVPSSLSPFQPTKLHQTVSPIPWGAGLSRWVGLGSGPYALDNVLWAARTFAAVNRCTGWLHGLHRNLQKASTRSHQPGLYSQIPVDPPGVLGNLNSLLKWRSRRITKPPRGSWTGFLGGRKIRFCLMIVIHTRNQPFRRTQLQ
jgi:hypothetical protein